MAQSMDVKVKRLSEMDAADKAAKGDQQKKKKIAKELRPHPVLYTFLITLLSMLLLIGAFILVCRLGVYDMDQYFNYTLDPHGYVRGPVLLFLNPEELPREEYYSLEIEDLYDQQTALEEQELELEALSEALYEREAAIEERETYLEDRLATVNEWLEMIHNSSQVSGGSYDIQIVADMLANMTPARAAELLLEYSEDNAAEILALVKKKQLGAIMDALTALDASAAAEIMTEMAAEPDYDGLDPGELTE